MQNHSEDASASALASSAQSARPPLHSEGVPTDCFETIAFTLACHESLNYPLTRSSGKQLRDAWIQMLAPYSMQWFCTLTFSDAVHPEQAEKCFRRWTNELNRSLYGRRWQQRQQGIYWVCASEYQKRGVLHFHVLIGDDEDINKRARRLTWMDRWDELAGYARIEKIKSADAVALYVTKYVVKGGQIDLSDNLRSLTQQQSSSNPRR